MKKIVSYSIPVIIILALWETLSRNGFVNPALFPPPSKVLEALLAMVYDGTLTSDVVVSFWRLLVGLFLGSVFGITAGLMMGRVKSFDRMVLPIIQALRPLPPVAIIPFIILWFGIGNGAKIFAIAFAVFFPVWVNSYSGAKQVPENFLWTGKSLNKTGIKIIQSILFPASLPFIVAGVRTGIAVAFVMVFVSELSGASSGLGYRISVTSLAYRIDQMMATLVVLGILGALTDYLFIYGCKKYFPWLKSSLQ